MRKSTKVRTNFFQSKDNADYYAVHCPINRSYDGDFSSCSGAYNNGIYRFYPVFSFVACQCPSLLDVTADYAPPTYKAQLYTPGLNETYPDAPKRTVIDMEGSTPCYFEVVNIQTENKNKPYDWSTMISKQLVLEVLQMPAGSEIHYLASFDPNYWMNQNSKKMEKGVIKASEIKDWQAKIKDSVQFKSTHKLYVLTRGSGTF